MRKMMIAVLSGGAIGLSIAAASAEQLSANGIREAVIGKRVDLRTPYGLSLPLRYESNGTVVGDISGFSMARMFAPRETGKWWIDGNRLCQQWPSWYDGQTFCFTITRTGDSTISWLRDDGYQGTARISG